MYVLAFLTLIVAVGITGMPGFQWRMPRALSSFQGASASNIPKTSPLNDALPAVNLKAGDAVLLYKCDRGWGLAALKARLVIMAE